MVPALRGVGIAAAGLGYGWSHLRLTAYRLGAGLRPRRGWVARQLGDLVIRVPDNWSEIELDGRGGYVIHNRPRRLRIDGDAVWYGSAIELRIRRLGDGRSADDAAMGTTLRTLDGAGGRIELVLAIAGGVEPGTRAIAQSVLRGARAIPRGEPIVWQHHRPAPITPGETLHERVAVVRPEPEHSTSRKS
jgi:hypothetical protein